MSPAVTTDNCLTSASSLVLPADCGSALDVQLGVYVSSVAQGSSFERAGVHCGDIIMQVRGGAGVGMCGGGEFDWSMIMKLVTHSCNVTSLSLLTHVITTINHYVQ